MSGRRRKLGRFLPFLVLLSLVAATACSEDDSAGPETGADVEDVADEDEATEDEATEDEATEDEATEDEGPDLAEEAAALVGETVTVSATITEVVSPSAFRIGENSSVLVLSAPAADFTELGFDLGEEDVDETVVQVTGTVREFDIAGFEDEFGVDYDDELFEESEGEHVLVADRVTTLTGQEVTIAGEVESVLSTVAFRLAGVGWDVLVLDAEQAAVSEGDFVQVMGTVRRFEIATLEDELGEDLDDALYEDFEGDLVLVAQNVQDAPMAPQG